MKKVSLAGTFGSDPALRLVLDSLTDQAVFTVDAEGFITTWNEGCRRLKGYSSHEAIDQHFGILYTAADRAVRHPEDNLRRAREEGQIHEEVLRVRQDGGTFMAEVSIYPIEELGQVTGFVKIVRDVSERRRLEEERDDLSERLRRSNGELEGFCESVSHDLRGPIRAIGMRSRIICEDFGTEVGAEIKTHLEAVERNCKRLGQIVDDLLSFARLGQGEVLRKEVDVSDMVKRLAAEIEPHCQGGASCIEVQEGVRASADPSLLEVVLRNLIENACKYSGPDVQIQVGMIALGSTNTYFVRDTGIGFEMQYAEKIFEPFQRLHGVSAYEGTGIGLANVRRIIERHGGEVWGESEPGKGATFFFTLERDVFAGMLNLA